MLYKAGGTFVSKIAPFVHARAFTSKSIGTHNGFFHCDEALAVYLLRHTQKFKEAQLIRTRDLSLLSNCDAVVDVGGEFDLARSRFDHHQSGFTENFDPSYGIKLSSAGLVYKYFGKEVISNIMGDKLEKGDDKTLDLIFEKLYKVFIRPIDAIDNGISCSTDNLLYIDYTGITHRVRKLNPQWYEEKTEALENARFEKASILVGSEFRQNLDEITLSWIPAKQLVVKGFENRYKHHGSGKVMVLDTVCPWHDHLADMNEDTVLYVVYPVTESDWRVQCVKKRGAAFQSQRPLPSRWRGIPKDTLRKVTALKTANFVHASGFIGGCGSYDDVMKMTDMALKMA
ncbi:unnamed protein product [Rhizopus stolonifer]